MVSGSLAFGLELQLTLSRSTACQPCDSQPDFTNMTTVKQVRYLLVLVDTFSGYIETFSTTMKRAQTASAFHLIPPF